MLSSSFSFGHAPWKQKTILSLGIVQVLRRTFFDLVLMLVYYICMYFDNNLPQCNGSAVFILNDKRGWRLIAIWLGSAVARSVVFVLTIFSHHFSTAYGKRVEVRIYGGIVK